MSLYTSEGSMSTLRAISLESFNPGGSCGTGGEYSNLFHLYTSWSPLPTPAAGSKQKANDLGPIGNNNHNTKHPKMIKCVEIVYSNVPLKKTWEMMELANHPGLLAKFQVSPLSCHLISILTLKVTHLACYGQEAGAVGELGRPIIKVQGQSQKNGELDLLFIWNFSHCFQVLDILKEQLYEVNLADYFQDVDSLLAIAFQIAIHNCRKHSKYTGEGLPASKCRGKVKHFQLHQGNGVQGTSTAEILKKKQGELEDRRKRRRDETVHTLLLFCSFCWCQL